MILYAKLAFLLSKSSGLQRKQPLSLPCCAGGGGVLALFLHKPWLWFEAVMIRVKDSLTK
jgi:hypothetical protein